MAILLPFRSWPWSPFQSSSTMSVTRSELLWTPVLSTMSGNLAPGNTSVLESSKCDVLDPPTNVFVLPIDLLITVPESDRLDRGASDLKFDTLVDGSKKSEFFSVTSELVRTVLEGSILSSSLGQIERERERVIVREQITLFLTLDLIPVCFSFD